MWWLLCARASAHGDAFGVEQIAVAPDDADAAWVLVSGWGLAHTDDRGATWAWVCEEALGGDTVLAVLAAPGGGAWASTRGEVLHTTDGCAWAAATGLPEGGFVQAFARHGDAALALVTAAEGAGVYRCEGAVCAATGLIGVDAPKSIVVDGARTWVTTVAPDLTATLWTTTDLRTWTAARVWTGNLLDPRVLDADGDVVHVWERARSQTATSGLLRSADGGRTWDRVLTAGIAGDPPPGWASVGARRFLGGVNTARTWVSDDDGVCWTEVSADAPAVRCGDVGPDGAAWICADHLQDAYDVTITEDGWRFQASECLQAATASACNASVCDAYAPLYAAAGGDPDAACAVALTLPPIVEDPTGCAGAPWLVGLGLGWRALRRRHRPSRT